MPVPAGSEGCCLSPLASCPAAMPGPVGNHAVLVWLFPLSNLGAADLSLHAEGRFVTLLRHNGKLAGSDHVIAQDVLASKIAKQLYLNVAFFWHQVHFPQYPSPTVVRSI